MMMPASFYLLSWWLALISFFSLASTISMWSHARSKQALQMTSSSSLVAHLMPWMVRDHFDQCTSRSRVWSARTVGTFSMWDARAGHWVSHRSSTLWDVKFIESSLSSHALCSGNSLWRWILSLVRRSSSSASKAVLIFSRTACFNSSWRVLFNSGMIFLFRIEVTELHRSFWSCWVSSPCWIMCAGVVNSLCLQTTPDGILVHGQWRGHSR